MWVSEWGREGGREYHQGWEWRGVGLEHGKGRGWEVLAIYILAPHSHRYLIYICTHWFLAFHMISSYIWYYCLCPKVRTSPPTSSCCVPYYGPPPGNPKTRRMPTKIRSVKAYPPPFLSTRRRQRYSWIPLATCKPIRSLPPSLPLLFKLPSQTRKNETAKNAENRAMHAPRRPPSRSFDTH